MKRVMLLCLMSVACGPQELPSDEQAAAEGALDVLPPVVNCAGYNTEATCQLVSAACAWRPVPCPLGASSGGGPTTCEPFACVSKNPGPTVCGTVNSDGTSTIVPCGGVSMGGGTTSGGSTSPGSLPPR